ncbi:hypothetical protein B0T24DRAFT_360836 [Lasiosphaeria ovina]|uniref:Uncharacterized protein n=1 Tax=Lasiosphaeria ovina TaxID=92902 RepID=A0AAE0K4E8_9PEZI|nr:hypothetical protein B0T24DRAFT_360836 [Lasiosphaeria ovina]
MTTPKRESLLNAATAEPNETWCLPRHAINPPPTLEKAREKRKGKECTEGQEKKRRIVIGPRSQLKVLASGEKEGGSPFFVPLRAESGTAGGDMTRVLLGPVSLGRPAENAKKIHFHGVAGCWGLKLGRQQKETEKEPAIAIAKINEQVRWACICTTKSWIPSRRLVCAAKTRISYVSRIRARKCTPFSSRDMETWVRSRWGEGPFVSRGPQAI